MLVLLDLETRAARSPHSATNSDGPARESESHRPEPPVGPGWLSRDLGGLLHCPRPLGPKMCLCYLLTSRHAIIILVY